MLQKLVAVCSCLLLFLRVDGWAQKKNDREEVDSRYIEEFYDFASVRTYVAQRNFNFHIRSKIGDEKKISYAPNVQGVYGFGLYYHKLGLELSLALPPSARRNDLFGKTRFWDFQINSYGQKIGYDVSFQWYKGFYQTNPETFNPQWNVQYGYPQRPDLRALNMGLNVYYVFNHTRFSYQAAFNQTERQIRSTGSFLLLSSLFYTSVRSDSSLYPVPAQYTEKQGIAFQGGTFNILSLAPGYAYTFVIKDDFYISPSLFWGVSLRQQTYQIDEERHLGVGIGQKINVRVAAGYYGRKVFAGLAFVTDNNLMGVENINLRATSMNVRLFVGYRFSRILGRSVQNEMLDRLSQQWL